VQEAPAASVEGLMGHVVLEAIKSDPAGMEILEIVSEIAWVFVTVTDFTPEVCPTCTEAQDKLTGETVTSCAKAGDTNDNEAKKAHSPAK